MTLVDRDDRAHRDAGAFHIDQQEGNALLRFGLEIGAHQAEHHVREMRLGGPDLVTGDDVVVAIALGFGAQGREVRPRSRRSEEHTSELQSLMRISYAVFGMYKKRRYSIYVLHII